MNISVVIVSYDRPASLERCLAALARQQRPATEVGVVARENDAPTRHLLRRWAEGPLPLKVWLVSTPGAVAAQNVGLRHASGDVLAMTDDDTEPWPDWLDRIHTHFVNDPRLGALGGRDYLYADGRLLDGAPSMVGRIQWTGRLVGNHHLGSGAPREVDILKGANMSFRRAAMEGLWFDTRLKGGDAEWCMELSLVFGVRRRGWKVLYDPAVAVDHHHSAGRMAHDRREVLRKTYSHGYNETLAMLDFLPLGRRAVYLLWGFLVGTSEVPGLVQWARYLAIRRENRWQRLVSAWRGRAEAIRDVPRHGLRRIEA